MESPRLEIDDDWLPYPHSSSPLLFDARGARRTASLFVEVSADTNRDPIFTMKDHRTKGMISAYEVFMDCVDEGDAAMKLVGCMGHWRKLCRCDWFMNGDVERGFEGLNQWRVDMLTRDMTRAKGIYYDRMRDGDLQAARAMITLVEKMYKIFSQMATPPAPGGKKKRSNSVPVTTPKVVDLDREISRLNTQD